MRDPKATPIWEDMTEWEQIAVSTMCGPGKLGWFQNFIPQFTFKEACRRHDFRYWRGGNKEDRFRADQLFLADMLTTRNCNRIAARLYHRLVRVGGWSCFSYGPQKTYMDLEQTVIDYLKSDRK